MIYGFLTDSPHLISNTYSLGNTKVIMYDYVDSFTKKRINIIKTLQYINTVYLQVPLHK